MRICELMEQRGIQRIQLADAMGVLAFLHHQMGAGDGAAKRRQAAPGWPPSCNAASTPSTAPEPPGGGTGARKLEKGVTYVLHTGAAADWPLD